MQDLVKAHDENNTLESEKFYLTDDSGGGEERKLCHGVSITASTDADPEKLVLECEPAVQTTPTVPPTQVTLTEANWNKTANAMWKAEQTGRQHNLGSRDSYVPNPRLDQRYWDTVETIGAAQEEQQIQKHEAEITKYFAGHPVEVHIAAQPKANDGLKWDDPPGGAARYFNPKKDLDLKVLPGSTSTSEPPLKIVVRPDMRISEIKHAIYTAAMALQGKVKDSLAGTTNTIGVNFTHMPSGPPPSF